MKLLHEYNVVINWENIPITKHPGETGFAWSRTYKTGNIRIRLVEYSPGFRSDHWCCKGHFIHILGGEICFEFKDGSVNSMINGMTCCLTDIDPVAHILFTKKGALILIVD